MTDVSFCEDGVGIGDMTPEKRLFLGLRKSSD